METKQQQNDAQYVKVPQIPPNYDYNTTNVNSNQPHVIVPVPMAYDQPKSYLAISILNTCCCCFVLGIVAIIFSVKTREANKYGNVGEAVKFSKKAKKFNILAFSIGCCFVILYVILTVIRASLNGQNGY